MTAMQFSINALDNMKGIQHAKNLLRLAPSFEATALSGITRERRCFSKNRVMFE